ncbi:type I secretion C-terminal target domain-containing protein, partial [Donghicola mangrovi]|uniref:calcium-binding protein n=1 Tax=Donghicola mangrovi TaxID=2729614 RepID=UPI0030B80117
MGRYPLDGSNTGYEIVGTDTSDDLIGSAFPDSISGEDGDDYINGGGGFDTIEGGDGDDLLKDWSGGALIDGGAGSDDVYASADTGETLIIKGGADNDGISVGVFGGSADIDAGDGDDYVSVYGLANVQSHYDYETNTYSYTASGGDVTVDGGAGNDVISLVAGNLNDVSANFTADAGEGNDTVTLSQNAAATVTLGYGEDTVVLTWDRDGSDYDVDRGGVVVTDFVAGAGGDKIDLSDFMPYLPDTENGNPFETYFRFGQSGADVTLLFSASGDLDGDSEVVLTLQNVTLADLTVENLWLSYPLDGSAPVGNAVVGTDDGDYLTGAVSSDTISGEGGSDDIYGNGGDDSLSGGSGGDYINGGAGFDTIEGGEGNDWIDDWSGGASITGGTGQDYINFSANANETVSASGDEDSDELFGDVYGGSASVSGGDGDDYISVSANSQILYHYEYDYSTYSGTESRETVVGHVTVAGGEGNDTIRLNNYGFSALVEVDAGTGDDTVYIEDNNAGAITLGEGRDTLVISQNGNNWNESEDIGHTVVTDFTVGTEGDTLDIEGLVQNLPEAASGNPFGTYLQIEQSGADVVLSYSASGDLEGDSRVILTLQNVQLSDFTENNVTPAYPLDGSTPVGETLIGTENGDYLEGTEFGDTISGEGGYDQIDGYGGDDSLSGGAENDYINGGTGFDTINGSEGDDDLYDYSGGASINGGAGDDYIHASINQRDTVIADGGDGSDYIDVSVYGGTAQIDAGAENDTVRVYGSAVLQSDYVYDPETGYDQWSYTAEGGEVTVNAGSGDDSIQLETSDYTAFFAVDAGEGDDTVSLSQDAAATITLGAGQDKIILSWDQWVANVDNPRPGPVVTDFVAGAGGDTIDLSDFVDWLDPTENGNPFETYFRFVQSGADVVLMFSESGDLEGDSAVVLTLLNVDLADLTKDNMDPRYPLDGSEPLGDTITGTEDGDYIEGTGLGDTISGEGGSDEMYGNGGNDSLSGGADGDYIEGGSGFDTIDGGDGSDNLYDWSGGASINGGTGGDNIYASVSATETVIANGDEGSDSISVDVYAGTAQIDGGDGDDVINASVTASVSMSDHYDYDLGGWVYDYTVDRGEATILGGAGNDSINVYNYGASGNSTVEAGDGDDTVSVYDDVTAVITLGAGRDTISVSLNDDWYSYDGIEDSPPVVTDFTAGAEGDVLSLSNLLMNLPSTENGNPFETYLRLAQSGDDVVLLYSASGNLDGNNRVILTLQNVALADITEDNISPNVPLDGSTPVGNFLSGTEDSDYIEGTEFSDTISGAGGYDNIYGNGGDDSLSGGADGDYISGGDGYDTIEGGDGGDTLYDWSGGASIDGGAGYDYIEATASSGESLVVKGGADDDEIYVDVYGGTAEIDAGDGDDYVRVYGSAHIQSDYDYETYTYSYTASGGDVTVNGGAGNDRIYLNAGDVSANFTADAGEGNDTVTLSQDAAATVALGDGQDTIVLTWDTYTYDYGVDRGGVVVTDFVAGAGGDKIDLSNFMSYLPDSENGNPFETYFRFVQSGADVTLLFSASGDLDGDSEIVLTLQNVTLADLTVENLWLNYPLDGSTPQGLNVTGSEGYDYLTGTEFADTINGAGGYDDIYGNGGNDSLSGGADGDYINGGAGLDTLDGGDGSDSLYDYSGGASIIGGAGGDYIRANAAQNDELTVDGGADDDTINVEAYGGTVVLDGGDGNDTITAELYDYSSYYGYDDAETAEVTVRGGEGDDVINITGYGELVNPTVDAGAGNDSVAIRDDYLAQITLGEGQDVIALRWAGYSYENTSPTVTDFTAGEGGDVVSLSDYVSGLTPTENGNLMETYFRFVQSGSDVVLVFSEDGDLESQSRVILTLQNVDLADLTSANLYPPYPLDGSEPVGLQLTGTADGDYLVGSEFNDTIDAGDGDDGAYGSGGNDSINGGAGLDQIYGGEGDDTIDGGDGADDINGEAGYDVIDGGAGDDYINENEGGASIVGGAGNDTVSANVSRGEALFVDGEADQDRMYISVYGGSAELLGGDGEDYINVTASASYTYLGWDYDTNTEQYEYIGGDVTVSGGNGNDEISLSADDTSGYVTVDAGSGDDTVSAYQNVAAIITLGDGQDTIALDWERYNSYGEDRGAPIVTDFETGAGGDSVDISGFLSYLDTSGTGNPMEVYFRFVQSGDDVNLLFSANGDLDGDSEVVLTLLNVAVEDLTTDNLSPAFPLDGSAMVEIAGDITTDASIEVGGSVFSSLDWMGDRDWFKVYLEAGNSYSFSMEGSPSGGGTVSDSYLWLYDAAGTLITQNDDGGYDVDALIEGFTPSESGYYFISAAGYHDGETGTYTLRVINDGTLEPSVIDGYEDSEVIYGTNRDDTIRGHGGDDTIYSYEGNDSILGGEGDDFINPGDGNDTVLGGAGNDTLEFEWGSATIFGEEGNDTIYGEPYITEDAYLDGGSGDDDITLLADIGGMGTVIAGDGDDIVRFGVGSAIQISLGAGQDTLLPGVWPEQYGYGEGGSWATVTDFEAGAGGDIIDLSEFISYLGLDPEAVHFGTYFALEQQVDGVAVLLGQTGNVATDSIIVMVLEGVELADLTADNFAQPLPYAELENMLPAVGTTLSNLMATEDRAFSFALAADAFTDADDVLDYTLTKADGTAAPSWITLSADGTSLTGTPPANFTGSVDLKITAADEEASVSQTFTLTVTNVNDAPTGGVSISGTAVENGTLTATTSSLKDADGLGTLSYAWLRDGVAISGATASTYKLGDADVGKGIKLQVSYTDKNGTKETVTSVATSAVTNVNDAPTGGVSISGTAVENGTLTATTSSLKDADGLGTLTYAWLRDGVAISGATASTYKLGDADVGKAIKLQVSYTDGNDTKETVTSVATSAVTNVNDAPTGGVSISGTAVENGTL